MSYVSLTVTTKHNSRVNAQKIKGKQNTPPRKSTNLQKYAETDRGGNGNTKQHRKQLTRGLNKSLHINNN